MRFTPWQLAEAISEEGKEAWSKPAAFLPWSALSTEDQGQRCGCGLFGRRALGFMLDTRDAESGSGSTVGRHSPVSCTRLSQGSLLATCGAVIGSSQSHVSQSSFHRAIAYSYFHSWF